jgi:hypothetical protein
LALFLFQEFQFQGQHLDDELSIGIHREMHMANMAQAVGSIPNEEVIFYYNKTPLE